MPSAAEILTELQPMFRDILDLPDLELKPDMSATNIPEWDSLNYIRLLAGVEQKFAIRLTGAEVEKLANVGDLARLIAAKLAA